VKAARCTRTLLAHRRLPLALAIATAIIMLPALGAGLFMDDLVQRVIELKPAELPARIQDTGLGFSENGKLGTVACDLFGLGRRKEAVELAKDYGLLTWWMPETAKAALWRPITAFTHWLDYRLFPNTPALMHAHSIVWFAGVVFLVVMVYRAITALGTGPSFKAGGQDSRASWIGGLAGVLFLLDKNTYFPVMFVANRGFIVALFFGLLCLYEHHRWRTAKSSLHLTGALLSLVGSLLANEGGASTLAFLVAYALVFEARQWRHRVASLLPAAAVVAAWRVAYVMMGFGVANLGIYIDPGYEPGPFLGQLFQRVTALLGGQLSGVPPEVMLIFSPFWRTAINLVFLLISLACAAVFLPTIARDPPARFWFFSMLLAVVPAATVIPLSKNLAFVAVGAFGVVASFLAGLISDERREATRMPIRFLSWSVAVGLLIAHLAGPVAARVVWAWVTPDLPRMTKRWCGFTRFPEVGDRDVIVVNNPCQLVTFVAPFVRAYYSESIPASFRTLLPANTGFRLTRASEATLIAQVSEHGLSKGLLACGDLGPVHPCYAFQAGNDLLMAQPTWKSGDRVRRKGFVTEILEVSEQGAPRKIAFHFDHSLDSRRMFWLRFDWNSLKYERFPMPSVGDHVTIEGPRRRQRAPTAAAVAGEAARIAGR